jgi:hypothetical protein
MLWPTFAAGELFKVMKKLERLAIAATALLVVLSYLGACGTDSGLHSQRGDGGNAGGGDGGAAGAYGTGGAYPGTGGALPGTGGIGTGGAFPGTGGIGTGGAFPGTGGAFPGTGGAFPGTGGAPGNCAQAGTQAACDANPSCYSVFFDPHNCACAGLGCCARFNHCAQGAGAQCYGGVSCALSPPFCEGPYVVSYRGDCFEGCVNSLDCAPVCTPGADQTCNDNPIVSSFHGHCTDAGTCQCNGTILNPNTGRCL